MENQRESRLNYLEKLRKITHMVHSADDVDDILLHLQDYILSLVDAERITIYAIDESQNEIYSKFIVSDMTREIRVPISKHSIAGYCALIRSQVSIADAYDGVELLAINHDLRFDRSWDDQTGFRTRQILASPIIHEDHLFGVVQVINKKNDGAFDENDQNAIHEIAEVLGLAMSNAIKRTVGIVGMLKRLIK